MMLVVPLAGSVRSVTTEGALSRRAVLVRTWIVLGVGLQVGEGTARDGGLEAEIPFGLALLADVQDIGDARFPLRVEDLTVLQRKGDEPSGAVPPDAGLWGLAGSGHGLIPAMNHPSRARRSFRAAGLERILEFPDGFGQRVGFIAASGGDHFVAFQGGEDVGVAEGALDQRC